MKYDWSDVDLTQIIMIQMFISEKKSYIQIFLIYECVTLLRKKARVTLER